MTDIGLSSGATVGCRNCGAQNDRTAVACWSCGQLLADAADPDLDRGDLELEEAVRALAVDGYDIEFTSDDGVVTCTACHAVFPWVRSQVEGATVVRDTATARTDLVVVALACGHCGTRGYTVGNAGELTAEDVEPQDAERQHTEGEDRPGHLTRHAAAETFGRPGPGKTPTRPLGEDRQHFVVVADGDTRSLRERGPLLDEDGTDIREYTGEPVETEEGTVIPQQQNVGPGNEAGGGEWPDPNAPSAQPG
jgi:hypothetical protein